MPAVFKGVDGVSIPLKGVNLNDNVGDPLIINKVFWKDDSGNISEIMGGGGTLVFDTSMSNPNNRSQMIVGKTKTYVVMLGGYYPGSTYYSPVASAFDRYFIFQNLPNQSTLYTLCFGTTGDNRVVYAGGVISPNVGQKYVSYIDDLLTRGSLADMSIGRWSGAATTFEGATLLAGGWTGSNIFSSVVDGVLPDGTRISIPDLGLRRGNLTGASTKNHAVFSGGRNSGGYNHATNQLDIYNRDFTRTTQTLTLARLDSVTVSTDNNEVLIAGGYNYVKSSWDAWPRYNNVTVLTSELVMTNITGLFQAVRYSAGCHLEGNTLIAGGEIAVSGSEEITYTSTKSATVYNETLTRMAQQYLEYATIAPSGVSFADRAIILGGSQAPVNLFKLI